MSDGVPRRTVLVLLLVVTLLSAGVGAVVATGMRDDGASAAVTDPLDAPRHPYTPVAYGNGLHISATWHGTFARAGRVGVLTITGRATGPWSGSGFLEVSLPPGWRAQGQGEAATVTGWVGPNPSPGVHYGLVGVVHPGARRIRFIAQGSSGTSNAWFAVDGVTTPVLFTGDADPTHQTEIHAVGLVLLD